MRREITLLLVGLLMLLAAPSAHAHGLQGIIQPLVIVAVIIGALGGLIAGGTGSHPGYGVLASLWVLVLFAFVYLAFDAEGLAPGDLFFGILIVLTLIAFAGAIPLTIVFFVVYALAGIVRERFRGKVKADDAAP